MEAERRERLNIHAIQVSLRSARLGLAKQDRRTTERGNELLDRARQNATSPAILEAIEAVQDDWDRGSAVPHEDEAQ